MKGRDSCPYRKEYNQSYSSGYRITGPRSMAVSAGWDGLEFVHPQDWEHPFSVFTLK